MKIYLYIIINYLNMEAPTIKEEVKVENSYKIISDKNNSFNLIFQNLNSSIQIIASYEDNILIHYYEKNIIFDELKKNKYFLICETIDEIYDELIRNLNKNQTKIIEETNQIIINIPTDNLKIKEILFIVNEKIKNDKETINELLSIISNLKQEINDLKTNKIENINEKINNLEKEFNSTLNEKINNLEKDNEEFKKDNSKLNEKINNLEKEFNSKLNEKINNLEKENEILKQYLPYLEEYKNKQDEIKIIKNLDSLIIENNIKYNKTLKNWIDPNIKIKSELLYRMSRDGIEYSKFHNLCDNKGATITLIKLEDGNILGNYTPLSWDSTSGWKNDLKMFVFNLTENIKCIKNNQNSYGIYCYYNYGPHTPFIWFNDDNKMNQPFIYPNRTEYNECNKIYSKSKGYYKSVEVEVFKIILD